MPMPTTIKSLMSGETSDRIDWAVSVVILLIVFGVYLGTLCNGVYPGASGEATGQVMGLVPMTSSGHSLAIALARLVAALPLGETPFLLNLAAAAGGGVAAVLLFLVAKGFILELTRPAPDFYSCPEADEETAPRRAAPPGEEARPVAATLGGALCVLAAAFSAPFWRASTSFSFYTGDIVLILLLMLSLLRCLRSGSEAACVTAMFLCGLGLIEAPLFLLLLPVTVFVVIRTVIQYGIGSERVVPFCLLAGTAGLAANFGIVLVQFSAAAGSHGADAAANAVRALGRAYLEAIRSGLWPSGWFFIWALPMFCLVLSILSVRITVFREEGVGADGWALIAGLTGAVVAQTSGVPWSAWAVARESDALPVFACLMIALTAGCVFAAGYMAAVLPRPDDEFYRTTFRPLRFRAAGNAVCGLLVIAALRQPCVTSADADGRKAYFSERVALELQVLFGSEQASPVGEALDLNMRLGLLSLNNPLRPQHPAEAADRKEGPAADLTLRLARFENVCAPLLKDDPDLPPTLRRAQRDLREYVGDTMNAFGKVCEASKPSGISVAIHRVASRMRGPLDEEER